MSKDYLMADIPSNELILPDHLNGEFDWGDETDELVRKGNGKVILSCTKNLIDESLFCQEYI